MCLIKVVLHICRRSLVITYKVILECKVHIKNTIDFKFYQWKLWAKLRFDVAND